MKYKPKITNINYKYYYSLYTDDRKMKMASLSGIFRMRATHVKSRVPRKKPNITA